MFKFLKDKLKQAINKFSKDVDEKSETEVVVEEPEEIIESDEPIDETPEKEPAEQKVEEVVEEPAVEEPPKEEPAEQEVEEEKLTEEDIKVEVDEEPVAEEPEEEQPEIEAAAEQDEPVKEEPQEEKPEDPVREEIQEEKPIEKPVETKEKSAPKVEEPTKSEPAPVKKKGIFKRIKERIAKTVTRSLSENKFDELFWELEVALLENNVALEVIDKIKIDLKKELVESKIPLGKTEEVIMGSLEKSINDLFTTDRRDIVAEAKKKKPYVVIFVGVNGVGKTTTIAKLAKLLEKSKLKSVIAAGDTFRAAAIQQLEEHANNLGVKLIKHDYGSDPAAVAYEAIKYAKIKDLDVVLVDTAGRQHSNANLMEEMKKISRVAKPDLKIFVGESITGNDCIEQAKKFNDTIGIDGIILTKADIDEKGGAAVSISYVTGKPILYIGTGQDYDSLESFQKGIITDNLGF